MDGFLAGLGTFGLALALTVLLVLGTKNSGGKLKPLSWGLTLVISMLAGSAYAASGPPFAWINDMVKDAIGMAQEAWPQLTMPAIALVTLVVLLFAKLSLRGVAIVGIVFFYVAANAGGSWTLIADQITNIQQAIAS